MTADGPPINGADLCDLCSETLYVEERAPVRPLIAHRECLLRSAMGGIGHLIAHEYWCVVRKDPDAGLTYRQSALLCDAWVHIMGVENTVDRGR